MTGVCVGDNFNKAIREGPINILNLYLKEFTRNWQTYALPKKQSCATLHIPPRHGLLEQSLWQPFCNAYHSLLCPFEWLPQHKTTQIPLLWWGYRYWEKSKLNLPLVFVLCWQAMAGWVCGCQQTGLDVLSCLLLVKWYYKRPHYNSLQCSSSFHILIKFCFIFFPPVFPPSRPPSSRSSLPSFLILKRTNSVFSLQCTMFSFHTAVSLSLPKSQFP